MREEEVYSRELKVESGEELGRARGGLDRLYGPRRSRVRVRQRYALTGAAKNSHMKVATNGVSWAMLKLNPHPLKTKGAAPKSRLDSHGWVVRLHQRPATWGAIAGTGWRYLWSSCKYAMRASRDRDRVE